MQFQDEPPEHTAEYEHHMKKYMVWTLCREACTSGKQEVPALSGFISRTGVPPKRKTTIRLLSHDT